MQKFITIDDKIISFDIDDLKVIQNPSKDIYPSRFWTHVRHVRGSFVLKVSDWRVVDHLIPDGRYFPSRSFDLSIYEGDSRNRSTWKNILKLSKCRFDISSDKEEYEKWRKGIPLILFSEEQRKIPPLFGTFDDQLLESTADCEA